MVRTLARTLLIALLLVPSACGRAYANMQTLVTDDCGVSWKLIQPGSTVPPMLGPCSYKITVPDYPMQGETKFKANFKGRVLASVEISYDYSITDAKLFIAEAKYLGKQNSAGDGSANAAALYETAENSVLDKRIREATGVLLVAEDIVDFSQAEFEDRLLAEVNQQLEARGVRLNSLTFVPIPQEQTRLAIDMATAMKVYESRGLGDLGERVSVARAGAPQITVTTDKAD